MKTETEKDISSNQTFYENLPFGGLKRPPTQVRRIFVTIADSIDLPGGSEP